MEKLMALKTLNKVDENDRQEVLERFIAAPLEQNFPQEVVALYLDCSPWTLAKMRCESNTLPFKKIGRRVAYKKSDVLAFEASKTVNSTAQYA